MPSFWVLLSLSPESYQIGLELGILGEGLFRNSTHWQRSKAPSLPPPFGALLINSFPKTGKGIRLTSGTVDAYTCPLSSRVEKRGRQKEGAKGALCFSADHEMQLKVGRKQIWACQEWAL